MDDQESSAVHRVAVLVDGLVIGTGRLHPLAADAAQIRYMAVAPAWRGRGVGRAVLESLEDAARHLALRRVVLEARESVARFYERAGYRVDRPGKLLFGTIPHLWMEKRW